MLRGPPGHYPLLEGKDLVQSSLVLGSQCLGRGCCVASLSVALLWINPMFRHACTTPGRRKMKKNKKTKKPTKKPLKNRHKNKLDYIKGCFLK